MTLPGKGLLEKLRDILKGAEKLDYNYPYSMAACVEGFVLIQFLGFYVYLNAHSRVTGNQGVPSTALIFVFGSEAALVLAGCVLHWFMKHLMH